MNETYKNAGVDIEAGDEVVKQIKPLVRSTFNSRVLTDIGLFGGFYDAKFDEYSHPILVSSTDGVGTKLKVAFLTNKHNTVGQCLVNHCVNDILCCGAKPLFFLDYFATGKINTNIAVDVISGFAVACKENDCALIGGETAEMPSIYAEGEYDISGTIVGIVDKEKIVDGKKIKSGDILIGLLSNGLHTNGYSLARAVLLKNYNVDSYIEELGETIGESLLRIHKSYFKTIYNLIDKNLISGISHITGGGILGNTNRIIPNGLNLKVDWNSWQIPPIFRLIQRTGNITYEEMRKVFNLGIGMILVVEKNNVDIIRNEIGSNNALIIGEVVS